MKEPFTYTAQDIERYHGGELTPAERHALEKAALDDPFLADALEGYSFTKTPSADLHTLQQKLLARIGKEKKRRWFFMGQPWMKIAALFISIAGGGWLVIQSLSVSNKTEVATAPVNNEYKMPATEPAVTDSGSVFSDTPTTNETVMLDKKVPGVTVQNEEKEKDKQSIRDQASIQPLRSEMRGDSTASAMALQEARIDKAKQQIGAAKEVELARRQESTSGGKKTNDTIKNVDVVMKQTEVAADEMVVINKNVKSNAPRTRSVMKVTVDTLEPAQGWGYFDDYVASNLKSPDELKIKPVSGEVELSFELNKEGEPVNITIIKSLCDKCDEEAKRLLKEGPKWKNKAKKGRVKIRF